MVNLKLAQFLRNVAAAYEIKNEKKYFFQILAYRRAADSIEHCSSEVKDFWDEGKLDEIPGVGESLEKYLGEFFKTGRVKHFKKVMKGIPSPVFDLLVIPNFGPKRAYKLVKKLRLEKSKDILKDLKEAIKKNKIAGLKGFGEKSQELIAKGIKAYGKSEAKLSRMVLPFADMLAREIVAYLRREPTIKRIDVLGSLRRRVSTVGDIDISIVTTDSKRAINHFISYPKKIRLIESGSVKASMVVSGGHQIDLMVQPEESYGSLLAHFTGSKHHNIALRELAQKKNMSISEHGIKKGRKTYKFETERKFYKFLKMGWIPPEIREDTGEVEAALKGKLPKLVDFADIKGDLHIHDNFDVETGLDLGKSSFEELLKEALKMGYEYIGFSDHSPSVSNHTDKQIYEILKRRTDKIEKIKSSNLHGEKIRVFNMLEVDILASSKLAVFDKALELLDGAIGAIHTGFAMSKKEMTKRILTALDHPKVKIFAHPTGRLLEGREGYELDWDKIFEFCLKKNKALEINAFPARLDLPDFLVREAVKNKVKMVINTDAHNIEGLGYMEYGVSVARRGWAEASDILNTLSYNDFEKWLRIQ